MPRAPLTDASGNASVKWTLGPSTGAQTVVATVAGLTPLTLSATANAEPAASVVVVSGDNQTGLPAQTLLSPIVAKVVDRFGNPVAGASVTFTAGRGKRKCDSRHRHHQRGGHRLGELEARGRAGTGDGHRGEAGPSAWCSTVA